MGKFLRFTAAAIVFGAATFSAAGAATAAPLNDPLGLCTNPSNGNCVWGTGHPRSNVDIVFPSNTPEQQAIVDYVTGVANDYYKNETEVRAGTSSGTSTLNITATSYTSGTPSAGTQTVVLKAYQFMNQAAHPNLWYKSFSFNNATQKPITFDSLFQPGTKPLDVIMPIVVKQISTEIGEPFEMADGAGLDPANYQNFAITNDSLIFFFGKDQLAVPTGDFTVTIPRNAVANLLSPGI